MGGVGLEGNEKADELAQDEAFIPLIGLEPFCGLRYFPKRKSDSGLKRKDHIAEGNQRAKTNQEAILIAEGLRLSFKEQS